MSDAKEAKKSVLIRLRESVHDRVFSDSVEESRASRKRVTVPSLVVYRLETLDELNFLPEDMLLSFAQSVSKAVAEHQSEVVVPRELAERFVRLLPRGRRDDNSLGAQEFVAQAPHEES